MDAISSHRRAIAKKNDDSTNDAANLSLNETVSPVPGGILPAPDVDALTSYVEDNGSDSTDGPSDMQVLSDPTEPTTGASVYELIAQLQQILSDSSDSNIAARMALNQSLGQARVSTLAEAIAANETAKQNLATAQTNLSDAVSQLSDAEAALESAQDGLTAAHKELAAAQNDLQTCAAVVALTPNDPIAQAKLATAQARVDKATAYVDVSQQTYDTALATRDTAAAAAIVAGQNANDAMDEATKCLQDVITLSSTGDLPQTSDTEIKTLMQVILEAMVTLSAILDKANTDKLHANSTLFRDRQTELQKECQQKALEYAQAVADQKHKQSKMKLLGKCFGWAITGLSVIAAVATGGGLAALVPAAATLGVAIADEVLGDMDKQTLTEAAMDPIMNGLTSTMTKFVKLCKPGISDEEAAIIAGVLATVVVVAAALVAAKAADSAGEAAGKAVDAAKKTSPRLEELLSRLDKIALGPKGNPQTVSRAAAYMERAKSATLFTNSVIQTSMQISVAQSTKDQLDDSAEIQQINAILEFLKKLVQSAMDDYSDNLSNSTNVLTNVSEMNSQDANARTMMARNLVA
jgi:hypothetical protein